MSDIPNLLRGSLRIPAVLVRTQTDEDVRWVGEVGLREAFAGRVLPLEQTLNNALCEYEMAVGNLYSGTPSSESAVALKGDLPRHRPRWVIDPAETPTLTAEKLQPVVEKLCALTERYEQYARVMQTLSPQYSCYYDEYYASVEGALGAVMKIAPLVKIPRPLLTDGKRSISG